MSEQALTETKKHEIFFSYAWGEEREKIVDALYESFLKDGELQPIRDKVDVGYTENILDFMRRIGRGLFVVVAISEKYILSEFCMYELYELYKNSNLEIAQLQKKIFPIRIELLELNNPDVIIKYVAYWIEKVNKWETLVKNMSVNVGISQHTEYRKMKAIADNIGDLLSLLHYSNALTNELLSANDFEVVKKTIKDKAKERVNKLTELIQKDPEQSNLLQKPEGLQFATRFADYDQILDEIKECEEELAELLPQQEKLMFKKKAELKAAQDKLLDFTKRVLATYETIIQQPINTERSKKAKELFEGGDLDGAIAVLSTDELDNELAYVKQLREHLQKEIEKGIQKAKMVAEDFLSRARYQAAKPYTPELIDQTIESFIKSIEALEYYDNLFEFGLFLYNINHSRQSIFYHEKALALHINEMEPENDRYATLLNNLGVLCKYTGNLDKAIDYNEKALAIKRKLFGEEDLKVAIGYNNLGLSWQDKGDLNKGIKYLEKSLAIEFKSSQEKKSNIARIYNNLGLMWEDKGNLNMAVEYLEKALAINLKLFGEVSPKVANSYNNLGTAWRNKGNLDKSINYLEMALAIDLKLFGEGNPSIGRDYNNLGLAWQSNGNPDKAINFLEKALEIELKLSGEENPSIAIYYNNIGMAWQKKGNLERSINYLEKALTIDLKMFGNENPNIARGYNNIGLIWREKGNLDKAIDYFEKALGIDVKLFVEESPNIARDYNNLGTAWYYKGDLNKCLFYLHKSLLIYTNTYGLDNPSTKSVKSNLEAIQAQTNSNPK